MQALETSVPVAVNARTGHSPRKPSKHTFVHGWIASADSFLSRARVQPKFSRPVSLTQVSGHAFIRYEKSGSDTVF
jgi:hypothetical protein